MLCVHLSLYDLSARLVCGNISVLYSIKFDFTLWGSGSRGCRLKYSRLNPPSGGSRMWCRSLNHWVWEQKEKEAWTRLSGHDLTSEADIKVTDVMICIFAWKITLNESIIKIFADVCLYYRYFYLYNLIFENSKQTFSFNLIVCQLICLCTPTENKIVPQILK